MDLNASLRTGPCKHGSRRTGTVAGLRDEGVHEPVRQEARVTVTCQTFQMSHVSRVRKSVVTCVLRISFEAFFKTVSYNIRRQRFLPPVISSPSLRRTGRRRVEECRKSFGYTGRGNRKKNINLGIGYAVHAAKVSRVDGRPWAGEIQSD